MRDDNTTSGIYCIENMISNKKYIGQSKNINDRWKKHISELNRNCHDNDYLQKSWNKYGFNNFRFYVLEYCDKSILDDREVYYIDFYDTLNRDLGYNLKSGGQNGGSCYVDESRIKLSKSIKKSYENSDLKEIRRQDALKQWSNPDYKASRCGENASMYGHHHTEEAKKRMSEARKGVPSPRLNTTPVLCIELNQEFENASIAGKYLSIDSCGILKVCRGERKTCGGYSWKFLKTENNIS